MRMPMHSGNHWSSRSVRIRAVQENFSLSSPPGGPSGALATGKPGSAGTLWCVLLFAQVVYHSYRPVVVTRAQLGPLATFFTGLDMGYDGYRCSIVAHSVDIGSLAALLVAIS